MPETTPRILVIEKDEYVRDLFRDILEVDGYLTLVTGTWLDPDDVQQLRPTAILADLLVDGNHGGWDYLRVLRSQPGMHQLPVIVCTENHEKLRDLTAADLALASTIIKRPFDVDVLLLAVSAVTKSHDAPTTPLPELLDLPTLSGSD